MIVPRAVIIAMLATPGAFAFSTLSTCQRRWQPLSLSPQDHYLNKVTGDASFVLSSANPDATSMAEYIKTKVPEYLSTLEKADLAASIDSATLDTLKANLATTVPRSIEALEAPVVLLKGQITASWGDFLASLVAVKATVMQGQVSYDSIIQSLNLEETSVWYFGAAVALLGVSSGMYEMDPKNKIPAVVVPGITDSKVPLSAVEKLTMLQEATKEVNAQLKELQLEKASVDYECATLKSDLRTVQNKLTLSQMEEKQIKASLEYTQEHFKEETEDLKKKMNKHTRAEKKLQKELASMQEDLTERETLLKEIKAKGTKDLRAERRKVKELEEQKASMVEETEQLKKQVRELSAKLQKLADVKSPSSKSEETPKTRAPKKKAPANNKQVASGAALMDLSAAFFADIEEPSKTVSSPPPATKRKTRKTATTAKKSAVKSTPNGSGIDWSQLSASTLKRKTVKDLTAYLEAKVSEKYFRGG